MNFLKKYRKRILLFLAVLGPSTITTMAGNDGAGVTTYSLAGAKLGYAILITLPFLTLLYAITQEMGSRIAVVTGKGLADLIRERFGVIVAVVMFGLLTVANFGSTLTNVSALKAASEILGIPSIPFIIIMIAVAFLLVTKADYQTNQKIFLLGGVLYLAYVFSALKGRPDWALSFKSMFVPTANLMTKDFFITAIAVLGTTITPWGQFFVQSYMKDKSIPVHNLRFAKIEAFFGASLSNMFTFFIIVATAATLFIHGIPLTSGEEAVHAIRPFAGNFSGILFGLGMINAAIIGMIIISLSTAYAFSEFFGFEGTLDAPFSKSRIFYGIFLGNLIISGLIVMLPNISLFKIVLYTQSLNAILLPVILFFLLKISNNKELMGTYTNNKWYNVIAVASSVLIIIASALAVITSFFS
jgi:NRAMP (natural resistance-associated macrophage protein)-like metal ion transporter